MRTSECVYMFVCEQVAPEKKRPDYTAACPLHCLLLVLYMSKCLVKEPHCILNI